MTLRPVRRGFTLIELLCVAAIMAILAGLIVAGLLRHWHTARVKATEHMLTTLEMQMDLYKDQRGSYPPADEDGYTISLLRALYDELGFVPEKTFLGKHPTSGDPILVDAFGHPFMYHPWVGERDFEGAHNRRGFDLWSPGEDGMFGPGEAEEDNFVNWNPDLSSSPGRNGVLPDGSIPSTPAGVPPPLAQAQ